MDNGITVTSGFHDRQVLFGIDFIQSLLKRTNSRRPVRVACADKNGSLGERKGNQGVNLDTWYHESMAKK